MDRDVRDSGTKEVLRRLRPVRRETDSTRCVTGPSRDSFHGLARTVLSGGYCIGCGACASVASDDVNMRLDQFGHYVPVVARSRQVIQTPVAPSLVCPFADGNPDEDQLAAPRYGGYCEYDSRIGYYFRCYASRVQEGRFCESGSSGGLVSWLACELLRLGLVDAVAHVRPRRHTAPTGPLFSYAVSRTANEVQEGAGSRYYPIEMSSVLSEVTTHAGRYAFVGLPCFVKALRLRMKHDPDLTKRIVFCIGLVCGHLKTACFAKLLAWQCGIGPEMLESISFRRKLPNRPSNQYGVELTGRGINGLNVHTVQPMKGLMGADWGHGLLKYNGCDYCDDVFAETADVVIGDAWLPQYVGDHRGTNIVVTRERRLDEIVSRAAVEGRVWLEPLDIASAVRSQSSNLRHRREGLAYRLHLADKAGRWRPIKRVKPQRSHLDKATRRRIELRMAISQQSHVAFREALDRRDFHWFLQRMAPLLDQYTFVSKERNKPAWKRAASRLRAGVGKRVLGACLGAYSLRAKCVGLKVGRALIIPPSSPGSLGDEAVVNGFVERLREQGMRRLTIVSYRRDDRWDHVQGVDDCLVLHKYFHGGSVRDVLRFSRAARRHGRVCLLGTDVVDGHHSITRSLRRIELLRVAARVGAVTSLVGCSFNDAAAPQVVDALRRLPADVRIYCRDPISHSAMEAALCRRVHLVADPAFLLRPDHSGDSVLRAAQWVAGQHGRGRIVLGINANHLLLGANSLLTRDRLVHTFVETISQLERQEPPLSFCLIPHDVRGEVSDPVLADAIFNALPDTVRQHSYVVRFPMTAAQAKAIVSYLDCVFSGKMHLAIACLGQQIPVGCITYQGRKFDGLFRHFGLEEMTIDPQGGLAVSVLVPFIRSLIRRRHALREEIARMLPAVRALAMKNYDGSSAVAEATSVVGTSALVRKWWP